MIIVTVIVQAGLVIGYEATEPVTIRVRDYDVEGTTDADWTVPLQKDEAGDEYREYEI